MINTLERSADGIDLRILDISVADMRKAAPDAIAMNTGVGRAVPHPLAEDLRDVNLASIACHFGGLVNTGDKHHQMKALSNGIRSLEFTSVIEDVAKQALTRTLATDNTVSRIARPLPQENLKPRDRSRVEIGNGLQKVLPGGELELMIGRRIDQDHEKIDSWGLSILVDRRDVINNDQALITQMFSEAGHLARRHEARQTINLLETNPTLPELDGKEGDERPWFSEADGNSISVGGKASDRLFLALDEANGIMRKQTSINGQADNIPPAIALCSADLEFKLRATIADAGLPLEVVPSPDIVDGRCYLMSDHSRHAALGVQFIGPPTAQEIRTWSLAAVPKMPIQIDGVGYKLYLDMKPVALSRRGIVRIDFI